MRCSSRDERAGAGGQQVIQLSEPHAEAALENIEDMINAGMHVRGWTGVCWGKGNLGHVEPPVGFGTRDLHIVARGANCKDVATSWWTNHGDRRHRAAPLLGAMHGGAPLLVTPAHARSAH